VTAAIVLDGLTRRFDSVTAVDGISFEINTGELFGLIGPDGAGKTTTLRMLAGVMTPSAGDAMLDGISVARDPEKIKHHIAYMSQRSGLYTDLTVRENIEFYADLYRVPRHDRPARMERLYAFSNLGPFEARLAGQLSGGMKQKLALCCALIHHPSIMLLDEPTFGVDPISRRDLWLIIHQMVSEGVTVLVSTAYLDEAERCDRIAMLHEGRIVALDRPAQLQARLNGRILAVRTTRPRVARDRARSMSCIRHASLFGDTLHLVMEDPEHDWPIVRQAFEGAGVAVQDTRPSPPSLEDVFIDLVTHAEQHDA
jgi:ABC-type multidrug transport system ATPase subunit